MSNAAAKLVDNYLGKREVAEASTQPEGSKTETMKALVWQGSKRVACVDKPKPEITHEKDVIVKVTACSVCSGSDSHLYSGEVVTMDDGFIMGHEACGVVESVGPDVKNFKKGDRVVIAFDVACGECAFCARQEYSGCDRTNDSRLFEEMYGGRPASAIFGYSRLMGNMPGSQAEYVRVPFADVNCYAIPDDVPDEKALFVSDVLSTSLHATELGEVGEGDTVVIWGLGPIGLYAEAWSKLKGAKRVLGVDKVPERLELARTQFGIEVLDRSSLDRDDVVSTLRGLFPAESVDVVIDATGFRFAETLVHKFERAVGLETDSPDILTECFSIVRKFGRVSMIADYIGYANHFPLGHIMMKHLTLRSGQCPVQKYFKTVMDAVQKQQIDPTLMVTHRLKLEDVPTAYERLFYKQEGYIKVLITPSHDKQAVDEAQGGRQP
uniref:Enoyl reductase (ER) domain-containing protein n=1 Tax=Globisporangium ultimum (strain ATCC 200006 / CBS 805.95 / DAOM BR144) TaxID=431595 RepID=K3XAF5_GLOUD